MLTHLYLVNQWQTWVVILAVVLLLFGATRLPALSKSLGQSIKVFRKEVKGDEAAAADETTGTTADAEKKPSASSKD